MQKKKISFENILDELLSKKKISFNSEENFNSDDENMKIEILKFICYSDGKLSIENLFKNNYPVEIIECAFLFFQKLSKLSLTEIIPSYEPENYTELKEYQLFKIYVSLTKKELLPFFLLVGFYSYIINRKNNISKIQKLQSNIYFEKMNNLYINLKNMALPQIIRHYSKFIISKTYNKNDEEEGDYKLSDDEFEMIFNSYSSFNDLYMEKDLNFLVDSIFSSITEKCASICLKDGNEFRTINALIVNLFDKIYSVIKNGYYEERDIKVLIDTLYDTIKEYSDYCTEINYISFVLLYCDEFKEEKMDYKLYTVCAFFRGLNPINFAKTFNKITFNKNENYFPNIEKFYTQISSQNSSESNITISTEINNNNTNNTQIKENNIDEKDIFNKEKLQNKGGKLDDSIKGKNIKDNLYTGDKVGTEKNILKNKKEEEINLNSLYERIQKLEIELAASKKKENDLESSLKQMEQKYKRTNETLNELKRKTSLNNSKFLEKIQNLNDEIGKLNVTIKKIKFRDISKIIINQYIEKFSHNIKISLNKKDKAYYVIEKILKDKEKIYFKKICDKYYNSNEESHFSGLLKNYMKNDEKISYNKITEKIIKDYLLHILEISKNENYRTEMNFIIKLFHLNNIAAFLCKAKKYF